MKTRYIFTLLIAFSLAFSSCKKEIAKVEKQEAPKEVTVAKMKTVNLNISGMTCHIGCAKTIQSKLSRKKGVTSAKVVFKDSLATIQYDANKVSSEELITFIDGIAGGDFYKASEVQSEE